MNQRPFHEVIASAGSRPNLVGLKWGRILLENLQKWKNKSGRLGRYKKRNEARQKDMDS